MKTEKISVVKRLVECAILMTIGAVLSLFRLLKLPMGGEVTLAEMLPVVIASYRHGLGWGMLTGLAFGIIQQLLGLSVLGYVTGWQSVVAVILLDYILAFALSGLGGIFRKPVKNQALSLLFGAILAAVLRYICHVISGATVWAGLSIPTEAALIYSLGYNATFMIPEGIILALTAYYIGSVLDFRNETIRTLKREKKSRGLNLNWIGGVLILAALIVAVVFVFRELQNAETGDFMITGLKNVDWKTVGLISGILFALGIVCFVAQYLMDRKKKETAVSGNS